jgi:hypothetical protein
MPSKYRPRLSGSRIEVLFGRFVMGLTWERLGSDYKVINRGLMRLGLLVLFFSPMIAAKFRGKR